MLSITQISQSRVVLNIFISMTTSLLVLRALQGMQQKDSILTYETGDLGTQESPT